MKKEEEAEAMGDGTSMSATGATENDDRRAISLSQRLTMTTTGGYEAISAVTCSPT